MRLFVRGRKDLHYGKVHEVRTAVELQTAGLAAARATPEDVARLRQLCDDYQKAIEADDLPRASELDFQFHQELAKASGNELLVAMLESIADVLREVRNQAMRHPGVAEAGRKARRAMEKHLAEAEQHWRGGWPAGADEQSDPGAS